MRVRWRRLTAIVLSLAALALVLGLLFADPLARLAVVEGAALFGYHVQAKDISVNLHHASLRDVEVRSRQGEQIFTARQAELEYRLRDLLPGSRRRLGLVSVDLDRPHLTVVRHADGSYNIPIPSSSQPSGPTAPFDLTVRVRDGSATLDDQTRRFLDGRRLAVENVSANASLHPNTRSGYAATLTLVAGKGRYPIEGRATLDDARGFEMQRWRAARIALAPLIDYAVNSDALHPTSGELRNLDVRIAGFPGKDGGIVRHLYGTASLAALTLEIGALAKPVRDVTGTLYLYDDGVTAPKLTAALAGTPLHLVGGLYGLSKPSVRFGVVAGGELAQLASVSTASAKLPVSGPIRAGLLIEGEATTPLVLADVTSSRVTFRKIPIDALHANVALMGREADLLHLSARYSGATVGAHALFLLEKKLGVELAARVHATSQDLPYLARAISPMPLDAIATLAGTGTQFGGQGILTGSSRTQQLAGTFAVDSRGVGTIGPLLLEGPAQSALYARVAVDQPRHEALALLDVTGLRLGAVHDIAIPGVTLPPLPALSGTLDAAGAGSVEGKHVTLAARAGIHDAAVAGITIAEAHAHAAGSFERLVITQLEARGPWGNLDGHGSVEGHRVLLDGRYHGELNALAQLTGGRIAMSGRADVPLRAMIDGSTIVAQLDQARFSNARVAGVPVASLDGTVGTRNGAYDVYALEAGIAGAQVVADGSLGGGGSLNLSAANLDVANVPVHGLPIQGGNISAVATVNGSVGAPQVDGSVVLSDARYQRRPLTGSTRLSYSGGTLGISDALVSFAGAAALIDGSVAGLSGARTMTPRYALEARVSAAPIGVLASGFRLPYPVDGSLDADMSVKGTGTSPSVAGRVAVPEGSVNGLRIRDARVAVAGNASDLRARDGAVRIGSTDVAFSGAFSPLARALHVRAPSADLSDFDDFFDPGDLLAGTGAISADASITKNSVRSNGTVALRGARYARYRFGATDARWNTVGRRIDVAASVAATTGNVALSGSLTLPATRPFDDPLHRTFVALNADAENVDTASWLAAAEYPFPLVGKANARVRGSGRYPNVALRTHAEIAPGATFGKIPIERLALDGSASGGRATIASAVLEIPSFEASASGTVGLQPHAGFAVDARLQSSDLGKLATLATGSTVDVAGTMDSMLHLRGDLKHPRVELDLAFDALRYRDVQVPQIRGVLLADERLAELRSGKIVFANGEVDADAHIPFDLAHGRTVPGAPVVAAVDLRRIDLASLGGALPAGSKVTGTLDGHVGVTGTLRMPQLSGNVALAAGSYAGPLLASPLRNVATNVSLAGHVARFEQIHMDAGGGTIDGSAELNVPDLAAPARDASLSAQFAARNAGFDIPKLARATVDGTVTVARLAAGPIQVGGSLTIPSARLNPNAFIPSGGGKAGAPPTLPLAFNLAIALGRDVRAQSGQVDVGADGSIVVGGTLAAPTLDGRIQATDGIISFYRTFRLQRATLSFSASNGLIPYVRAVADTHVPDPSTDVTLSVTGPATQLDVALSSDPTYDRSQILGLLVGAQQLGAVSGVAASGTQNGPTVTGIVGSIAQGALSQVFTRSLLEPLSTTVGSALGLQRLAINYDPGGGGFAATARKGIAKNLDAVFAQSFGYPQRQSYGLEARPSRGTAIQLSFFQQQGSGIFAPQTLSTSTNQTLTVSQPSSGSNGFSFVFKRSF